MTTSLLFRRALLVLLCALGFSFSTLHAEHLFNENRYITLTVKEGATIKFGMFVDEPGTWVRIASGSTLKDFQAPSSLVKEEVVAGSSTMTIYGNVRKLLCQGNGENIIAINASSNAGLTSLHCQGNSITALTLGKNDNLQTLVCSDNRIQGLALAGCPNLTGITCSNNAITALSLSGMKKLSSLLCQNNRLSLLKATNNPELEKLDCSVNELTELNMDGNQSLSDLMCHNNKLATINVASCAKLRQLDCSTNSLTALDLSACVTLKELNCSENQLNSLKGPSGSELKVLNCRSNQLTSLPIGGYSRLQSLNCAENQIAALDLPAGGALNDVICAKNNLDAKAFDNLICSLPDRTGSSKKGILKAVESTTSDEAARLLAANGNNATAKNWQITDMKATPISGFKGSFICGIPKDSFVTMKVKVGAEIIFLLTGASGKAVRVICGSYDECRSLPDGRFSFVATDSLVTVYGSFAKMYCSKNYGNLTALDASHYDGIYELDCSENAIASLKVNTSIHQLNCRKNRIEVLDLQAFNELWRLDCDGNGLTSLNLGSSGKLMTVYCSDNNLETLDVSGQKNLLNLFCSRNALSTLDVSQHASLNALACSGNRLSELDVRKSKGIQTLSCSNNSISELDLSENKNLESLNCSNNSISKLDLSENKKLQTLDCSHNSLSSLDLDNNAKLTKLNCSYNPLHDISIKSNPLLSEFKCNANGLSSIDITANPALSSLSCFGNGFTTATLNALFCALPSRTGVKEGVICVAKDAASSDVSSMMAANGNNAMAKNWKVVYNEKNEDFIHFTSNHDCDVNMDSYITLRVKKGGTVKVDMQQANWVKIVCGETVEKFQVPQGGGSEKSIKAKGDVMTIYGDIPVFLCSGNGDNITGIDVSHSGVLTTLRCQNNQIESLICENSKELIEIDCGSNKIKELYLSGTKVSLLRCLRNPLSDEAWNKLFCSLPSPTGKQVSTIEVLPGSIDQSLDGQNMAALQSANGRIAIGKDWQVKGMNKVLNADFFTGTAECGVCTYSLTYSAGPNGSIKGNASQAVHFGADGEPVEAVPEAGYRFVKWSDGKIANPRQDQHVEYGLNVSAEFERAVYTLRYAVGEHGELQGIQIQTVRYGDNGTAVSATSKDAKYVFKQWSDGDKSNPRRDMNVKRDITATAEFELMSFTLSYTATPHGRIKGNASQTVHIGADGEPVEAVPEAGYRFVRWSDGITDNPRQDKKVDRDATYNAEFETIAYSLTYSAGPNGSIKGSASQTVHFGADGEPVEAVPATGYRFVRWSDGITDNPRRDTKISKDINVTAAFENGTAVEANRLAPLAVHPNPTNSGIYMEAEGLVAIYDSEGRLVLRVAAKGNTFVDLHTLPAGVYLVRTGDRAAKVVKR